MKIEVLSEGTHGEELQQQQEEHAEDHAAGEQESAEAPDQGQAAEEAKEVGEKKDELQSDDGEVVVSIGDEKPQDDEVKRAPEWVRKLRKDTAEKSKRIRELETKLAELSGAEKKPALGDKPTLEGCGYDEQKFDAQLASYYERKRAVDDEAAKAKAEEEEHQRAWQQKLESYGRAKSELRVADYEEAEIAAQEVFSTTQQGILINGADNPAVLVYALGKDPERAKKLAAIKDPVKFAFAVAKIESQLKVQPRKQPPLPEKVVKSSGRMSGAIDHELERLREEAARTGDISKVVAYKDAKRRAAAG